MPDELGWTRLAHNLWEFKEGPVIWGSAVLVEDGWFAVCAVWTDGPFATEGDAMDAAEGYWQNQNVGPFEKDKK